MLRGSRGRSELVFPFLVMSPFFTNYSTITITYQELFYLVCLCSLEDFMKVVVFGKETQFTIEMIEWEKKVDGEDGSFIPVLQSCHFLRKFNSIGCSSSDIGNGFLDVLMSAIQKFCTSYCLNINLLNFSILVL